MQLNLTAKNPTAKNDKNSEAKGLLLKIPKEQKPT